jgi:hypothetical protein
MTLTKADFAESLLDELGLDKREAKAMVELFFEEIKSSLEQGKPVLRPTVFKVNRTTLFEVSQWILSHAFIGSMPTEDSARQNAGFQSVFCLHQGFKGSQKSICC